MSPASFSKSYYDQRIDFFRGVALVFIFINHIPDNLVTYLTSRTFTLFDSAEVFMFLAGYSAALGYYSVITNEGLQAAAGKALHRARKILAYHVLLVIFVMAAAWSITECCDIKTGYEAFIEKIQQDPVQVAFAIPLLAFQAPLLDILPMYVVVMLVAPFLLWMRARSEIGLLAASGLMWLFAARFFPAIPTVTYGFAWSFNPFCWQFLFAIGIVFGWRTRTNAAPVCGEGGRFILDICCALFVVFSACVLMTIAFQSINLDGAQRLRAMYFSLNKQTLDLWRLMGLLASAYLAARLVTQHASWLRYRIARWLSAVGSVSLPIFSLSVVLSFLGKFAAFGLGGGLPADAAVSLIGAAIMVLTAYLIKGAFKFPVPAPIFEFVRSRHKPSDTVGRTA